MTIEKLIQKAYEFEKKNKSFTWKPKDFPEDMSESSTIDGACVIIHASSCPCNKKK